MECSEFEAILQERLDQRLPLPLGDEARAHLRQCFACEQDYQFFQQLARVTQHPASETWLGSVSQAKSSADPTLDQVIGRCVAALGHESEAGEFGDAPAGEAGWEHWPGDPAGLVGHAPNSDDGIPVARWVSLPGESGPSARTSSDSEPMASHSARPAGLAEHGLAEHGLAEHGLAEHGLAEHGLAEHGLAEHGLGMWAGSRVSRTNPRRSADRLAAIAAVVSAALLLVAVGWMAWHLTPTNPQLSRQSTEPNSSLAQSAGSPLRPQRLAGTPLVDDELREIAKNWDDSVVAFDRGWQQMAVGRVRAHQIPGMQPAVYPITGAVEAFRKNWIRRNPDGLAAGLQW